MMKQDIQWQTGTPKQLLADLRPGGWAWGYSKLWPDYLRLHKSNLIYDVSKLSSDHVCTWKVIGNPHETGMYSDDRRTVLIWLGS